MSLQCKVLQGSQKVGGATIREKTVFTKCQMNSVPYGLIFVESRLAISKMATASNTGCETTRADTWKFVPPWLFEPLTRWRQAKDPFFEEGNKVCHQVSKQIASDVVDENESETTSK